MINDLSDKRYILSVDLALAKSGWCVYDLKTRKIIDYGGFKTKASDKMGVRLRVIYKTIKDIAKKYPNYHIIKESLPRQSGKFTTIKVLQGLAQAHGALEMFYPQADEVHPVTIKCRIGGNRSASKDDVREIVNGIYNLNLKDNDTSDSVAVLHGFKIKFNQNIDDEIKKIRKKMKTLKTDKAVKNSNVKIEELENRKIEI